MGSTVHELDEQPFFAAGTSPFRSKGTTYVGHVQWVVENFPGGKDAYLECFTDPALRAFHAQPFMAPTWYDFMPLACAGHTCARAMNMSFEEFIEYRARYQADHDMRGVYKFFLALAPNALLAKKLTGIMVQYFDFGTPLVIAESKGHVVCEVQAMPTLFVPWMRACIKGFVETVLDRAGAKNVKVVTSHTASGTLHDFPASVLGVDITWA
ncbi:MAG: hypothetical protein IT381_29865 [Deltaproteobacteria bacterium]|nr:hypothetical protein [Deltaproteobacteria bacterium]